MEAGEKRKHITLDLQTKLEILRKWDKGETMCDLAKQYGVGRSTIFGLRAKRTTIENYVKAAGDGGKRKTLRLEFYPELEEALFEWYLEEPCRHKRMTGPAIQKKATSLYRTIYGNDDFRASSGWLAKFRQRLDKRLSTAATSPSTSIIPAQSPTQEIQRAMQALCLSVDQVYGAGEGELFWRLPPRRRQPPDQAEGGEPPKVPLKDRMTLVTCANARGTHKLKLLCIFSKTIALKDDLIALDYKFQKNGCFTTEVLKEWFHETFVPEVQRSSVENKLEPKALLLLDNALDPGCQLQSSDGSVEAMFLPLNDTKIQPMNREIIQLLKTQFKKRIITEALSEDITISGKLRNLGLKDALLIAAEAWTTVPGIVIESSWKKSWQPYSDTDEDEDDYDPEFLVPITTVIRSASTAEFTGQELLDWFADSCDERQLSEGEDTPQDEIEVVVNLKEEFFETESNPLE